MIKNGVSDKISSKLLSLIFTLLCTGQQCVNADQEIETYTPDTPMTYAQMTKRFDFAFFIEVEKLDHFLQYKGSQFGQICRVTVSFRRYARPGVRCDLDLIKYKELYYSGAALIGAHQFNKFEILPGTVGAIRLVNNENFDSYERPIVSAMVRALLDMSLENGMLGLVLCPKEHYLSLTKTMQGYGFYPTEPGPAGNPANTGKKHSIILHLYSEPRKKDYERSYCYVTDF